MVPSARVIFCIFAVCLLGGCGQDQPGASSSQPSAQRTDARSFPLPSAAPSPYQNTTAAAEFVGSGACADCHVEQSAGFSATPHNHALQTVIVAEEPADGEFVHRRSEHRFRVYRQDGRLRHRAVIPDVDSSELLLGDHPVAYRIGSGHHSRSYLIDIDGYLLESPITWYTSAEKWAISPGYDAPVHESFSRAAHEGCVHCHAGRVEAVGGSSHRLEFEELSIGCESCHGPGSLHVRARADDNETGGKFDDTIVHPGNLSRELNEAICARCHLQGAGVAYVRGRHRNDYRPGLRLTDFRIDYFARQSDRSMKVVGHFDQLRQSPCYTESSTLTCTTCHNPHARPSPETRVAHYRRKCLDCHDGTSTAVCRLPETTRLDRSPENDCVACHMPQAETNIPHFAFTHHRIGLSHSTSYREQNDANAELVPTSDVSALSDLDQKRCLGLAYLKYGDSLAAPDRNVPLGKAMRSLEDVYNSGLRDPTVTGGLAYLYWGAGDPRCIALADAAVASADCEPETRSNSLIVLGDMKLQTGDFAGARTVFEQLTKLRSRYTDWQMLGLCRSQLSDGKGAIEAYEKALSLRPDAIELRLLMVDELFKAGRKEEAARHREVAESLKRRQATHR